MIVQSWFDLSLIEPKINLDFDFRLITGSLINMIGGETWIEKFQILQNLALLLHGCHHHLSLLHQKVRGN